MMEEPATELTEATVWPRRRAIRFLGQPLYANAFHLSLSTGVSAIGGFVFWALTARLYSPEAVGLGSATLAAMSLLGSVAHLGLGNGLVRYLPGAGERRHQLVDVVLTLSVVTGVLASVVFLLGLPLWSPGLLYVTGNPLRILAFILFVVSSTLTVILRMGFVALRYARHVVTITLIHQLVRIILPFALVSLGAFGIFLAGGLSTAVGAAAGLFFLSRLLGGYRPRAGFSRSSALALVPYGLANQVADLALAAPGLLLPIIIVDRLGATSGGHFYIGFFVGAFLSTGAQSLATSLFAEGSHDEAKLPRRVRHALLGAVCVTGAGALVLLLFGGKLLLIFGSGYASESTRLLQLVALAAIPASATYVVAAIQRVQNHVGQLLSITGAVCLSTLLVSYLLLPRLGIVGAGVGVLAGQSLGALACLIYLVKEQRRAV